MQRVKMLEIAAEDLVDFHSQVSKNYKILTITSGPLKCAKDTIVSPDTIKARPLPKSCFHKDHWILDAESIMM